MADLTRYGATDDQPLLDAIDAIKSAEKLLAEIAKLRKEILDRVEDLEQAVTSLPQTQLDLRMARLRLTARLANDPDKTPVEHVKGASQMTMRAADPKKPDPLG